MNWKNLAVLIFWLVFFIFCMFSLVNWLEPVEAASPSLDEGCVSIGTIGTVSVSRCYDEETGAVIYGNSVGWMSDPYYY